MPPPKKSAAGAPARGAKRLSYEKVRDSFLAETPVTPEEELHYFTRIGMYVFRRWQAIADDHDDDQPIDEAACDARWDECTERGFQKIRDDAALLVETEVGRGRYTALVASWRRSWAPVEKIMEGLSWIFWRALEHFVGAIGLLLFGLLLVWLAPQIVKEVRASLDETLPVDTRPHDPAPGGDKPAAP
ncbi:MAG TPA: hypothetical protein VHM92_09275 [Allosphingosinicella sp.]|nr:hypothetical protein [Allosphingosinicella sp.]